MHVLRWLLLGVLLVGGGRAWSTGAEEKEAIAAGEAWLKLVDAGQAGASWDAAASFFKTSLDRAAWEKTIRSVRAPLGKLVSRKLTSRTPTHTLPGAPDGTYLVLQYASEFEHKKAAVETLIPMVDTDGRWRVSGYFIR